MVRAEFYPAIYWYAMLDIPDKNMFPGTGTGSNGNGIAAGMKSQEHVSVESHTVALCCELAAELADSLQLLRGGRMMSRHKIRSTQ